MQKVNLREYSLDFLKTISTFLIVFHHYKQIFPGNYTAIEYYGGSFYFGNVVELFFILSGYFAYHLVSSITAGEPFSDFITKRLRRVLPVIIIAAVADQILCAANLCLFGTGTMPNLWGMFTSAFAVQDGGAFLNQRVNNPTWYISVLMICYCLLYFTTWLSQKLSVSKQWLYVGIILIGASALSYEATLPFLTDHSARGYMAFFVGVCLAMTCLKYEPHKKRGITISAALFLAVFVFLYLKFYDVVNANIRFNLVFLVYPALILVFKSPLVSRIFSWSGWGFFAAISFHIYVWHNNMFKAEILLSKWISRDMFCTRKAMIIYTIACIIVGVLSYYCIERSINRYIIKKKSDFVAVKASEDN